jgi:hypothetical protein
MIGDDPAIRALDTELSDAAQPDDEDAGVALDSSGKKDRPDACRGGTTEERGFLERHAGGERQGEAFLNDEAFCQSARGGCTIEGPAV